MTYLPLHYLWEIVRCKSSALFPQTLHRFKLFLSFSGSWRIRNISTLWICSLISLLAEMSPSVAFRAHSLICYTRCRVNYLSSSSSSVRFTLLQTVAISCISQMFIVKLTHAAALLKPKYPNTVSRRWRSSTEYRMQVYEVFALLEIVKLETEIYGFLIRLGYEWYLIQGEGWTKHLNIYVQISPSPTSPSLRAFYSTK